MHPEKFISSFLFGWLILCLCLFASVGSVRADNWQARLYEVGAPNLLVGVDKKNRTFNMFEKNSPLKLRYSYPCVTGQLPGDKQQINDLRTPEGIYFVEYKIAGGLDFREYGGIAYTLNYPNPVDRLRGKTGHGIWIHSKGFGLVPTKGCVAINLRNITEIGPLLTPGTAVVVAEELGGVAPADNGSLAALKDLMREWSAAWADRSPRMFDFYDPGAYTKATENFDAFRQNKERLFKILDYIKIYNREIHALEGPGYWVTWSEQYYTASNLSTEGVRRLYWQKDDTGNFKIVGMEWTPRDVGMRADYQKGRLVAAVSTSLVSDAGSEAPRAPRLDMPEQAPEIEKLPARKSGPVEEASRFSPGRISAGVTESVTALARKLFAISDPLVPKRQPKAEPPDEISWGSGKPLTEPVQNPPKTPAIREVPEKNEEIGTSSTSSPKEPENSAQELDESSLNEVRRLVDTWVLAYRNRDNGIAELYDQKDYNRLPASAGIPRGKSYAATLQGLKNDFRHPWLEIVNRDPELSATGPIVRSQIDEMLVTNAGRREGVRTLWWRKNAKGDFKIVGSEFKPRLSGLEANYLENVSGDVSAMIEAWRKAWESGNLDEYMEFYALNANQQGRIGQNAIRHQKQGLWSRVQPVNVRISGLRLALDDKGIRADMNQAYADTAGRSDKGIKTLLLRYDGKRWLIQREDWVNPAQAATLR